MTTRTIHLTRDSVCMADDGYEHKRVISVPFGMTVKEIIRRVWGDYLREIGKRKWIAYSGDERLLFSEIPGLGPSAQQDHMVDVNLSSLNVTFKADQDLYVGVAVENAQPSSGYEGYLFFITYNTQNCFGSRFNKSSSNWQGNNYAMVLSATVIPEEWPLANMGFNAIAAGAKSVSLTSGKHTITASYTLADGTSETLELMVNVK